GSQGRLQRVEGDVGGGDVLEEPEIVVLRVHGVALEGGDDLDFVERRGGDRRDPHAAAFVSGIQQGEGPVGKGTGGGRLTLRGIKEQGVLTVVDAGDDDPPHGG